LTTQGGITRVKDKREYTPHGNLGVDLVKYCGLPWRGVGLRRTVHTGLLSTPRGTVSERSRVKTHEDCWGYTPSCFFAIPQEQSSAVLVFILLISSPTWQSHLQRTKMEQEQETEKRKPGRPKKGEIVAKKTKNKGILGRPKGDTAIINEYKARMLNSPKSAKVLEAIYDAALNDDHKNQAAAWKLIVDRIVPVSAFEATKSGGGTPQISINISGLNSPTIETVEDVTDVEIKDYEEDDNG